MVAFSTQVKPEKQQPEDRASNLKGDVRALNFASILRRNIFFFALVKKMALISFLCLFMF